MRLGACGLALIVAACSRGGDHRPAPAASSPVASAPAASKGTLALGEPITVPFVPLAEIAKSPARYENHPIATSGTVTAVCQAMGCWMEIRDEAGQAHVKMHGHHFFVPKTSAGHMARVQANVLPAGSQRCEESPPPETTTALVELDATGIELD
jgi:uncharacterized protein DUF4920